MDVEVGTSGGCGDGAQRDPLHRLTTANRGASGPDAALQGPVMAAATVRPTWRDLEMAVQGQPMKELLNGASDGVMPGSPAAIGAVAMPPDHRAKVHRHRRAWIYIFIVSTGREGVCTLLGDDLDDEQVNYAGDILVVPPGETHVAVNLSTRRWVYALELRVAPTVHVDNLILPHLQHLADRRRPNGRGAGDLMGRRAGRGAVMGRRRSLATSLTPASFLPIMRPAWRRPWRRQRRQDNLAAQPVTQQHGPPGGGPSVVAKSGMAVDWSNSFLDAPTQLSGLDFDSRSDGAAPTIDQIARDVTHLIETTATLTEAITALHAHIPEQRPKRDYG